MIECIFTLDYEIYGNGTGSLKELVYEPAERLRELFLKFDARFVAFIEAAELEKIEACGSDRAIDAVKRQVRQLHKQGFEIGLHLHPQWANARYERAQWALDYSEYNLCTLPRARIAQIVGRSLDYLREITGQPAFVPLAFRAGNWLFQPAKTAAAVLAEYGIRIDSSVFKGGVQHRNRLDYRPALENGYYWRFSSNVSKPDPGGEWLEIPIYTRLVPCWTMATPKRLGFKNSAGGPAAGGADQPARLGRIDRLRDLARLRYPRKLDFCRMTLHELTSTMNRVIQEDQRSPEAYKPIVAIGHTKDLTD
ncbi:MAG: hypothetical protein ACRD1N_01520, partial [Terriglobia bacterium]